MSLYYAMDKVQIQAFKIFHILALMLCFKPCSQLLPYTAPESHRTAHSALHPSHAPGFVIPSLRQLLLSLI